MSFYLGKYLLDQESLDPLHTGAWFMPDKPTQHMAETSNVEELQVLPTDMDSVPTQIQFGACSWTDDDGSSLDDQFISMFYQTGNFYTRSFTGTDLWTPMFYQTGNFYTRSFTGTDLWTPMFYQTGNFYVKAFTAGSDLYSQFYVKTQESFYVRSWTPVNFFYSIDVEDC